MISTAEPLDRRRHAHSSCRSRHSGPAHTRPHRRLGVVRRPCCRCGGRRDRRHHPGPRHNGRRATRTAGWDHISTRSRACVNFGGALLLPGHGPVRPDVAPGAAEYLAHRYQRLGQVRAALAAGAGRPREVVEIVYADVDRSLWPAAEQSVRAQLDYLTDERRLSYHVRTVTRMCAAIDYQGGTVITCRSRADVNAPAGATAQCRAGRPNVARAATSRVRRSRRALC